MIELHLGGIDRHDAEPLQPFVVCRGNRPSDEYLNVFTTVLAQVVDRRRDKRIVAAGEDAEAERIGILVDHHARDIFRGLPESRINDVRARVPERQSDDFCAGIVPVEARLRDDDSLTEQFLQSRPLYKRIGSENSPQQDLTRATISPTVA